MSPRAGFSCVEKRKIFYWLKLNPSVQFLAGAVPTKLSQLLHKYRAFKKELYNVIPNITLWRVLRKHLHSKAYKLSIVQVVDSLYAYQCKRSRNTRTCHKVIIGISRSHVTTDGQSVCRGAEPTLGLVTRCYFLF
jgi:hypothetical protein